MLLDILFPKKCLVCNKLGPYICLKCQKKLKYIQNTFCFYCEKNTIFGLTHESCGKRNEIDGFMTILNYNPVLKKIIKSIKYKFVYTAFKELYFALNPLNLTKFYTFSQTYPNCVLQPIPLHKDRYNWRGFNQAEIIAKMFSHITKLPIKNLISRKKNTKSQAITNNRLERYYNIKNAFIINKNLNLPENVILVDDVVTTGNTIKEAVKLLKSHGVKKVFVFSLAKG